MYSTEFSPAGAGGSGDAGGPPRVWSESSWSFGNHTGMLSDFAYFRVQGGKCVLIDGFDLTPQPTVTPMVTPTITPTPNGNPNGNPDGTPGGTPGGAPTTPSPVYSTVATPSPALVTLAPAVTTLPSAAPPTPYPVATPSPTSKPIYVAPTAPPVTVPAPTAPPVSGGENDDGNEGGGEGGGNDDTNPPEEEEEEGEGLSQWKIYTIGAACLGAAGVAAVGGTYAHKKGWFAGRTRGEDGAEGAAQPNPDVDEFAP